MPLDDLGQTSVVYRPLVTPVNLKQALVINNAITSEFLSLSMIILFRRINTNFDRLA